MSKRRLHAYKFKYWPSWFGVGVLWSLSKLPFRWQLQIGRRIGRLLPRFSEKRSHRVDVNLELCFPELTLAERNELKRKYFESVGISIFETSLACWGSKRRLKNKLRIIGGEHYYNLEKTGKSVLILSPHFTTLHIVGRLISMHTPFAVMYNTFRDPVLEKVSQKALRYYERAIKRSDVRGLIRTLKEGYPSWYAADVNPGHREAVFAPFFDMPIATLTSTSRIAELSDAIVLPAFFYRRDDGKGYDFVVKPPLENFPSGDLVADATQINKVIEMGIREKPEQYFWQYRRFIFNDREPPYQM